MTIEGFDAALPIEDVGFRSLGGFSALPDTRIEPSLQSVLHRMNGAAAGDGAGDSAVPGRGVGREAMVLDLWIDDRTPFQSLTIAGPGAPTGALFGDRDQLADAAVAEEDGRFILRDLSLAEKHLVAGGLGTTDEYWGDEEDEYDQEVVVTAPEEDNWDPWDDNPVDQPDNDSNPDGDGTGQGGPADPSTDPYAARVTIDDSVPAEQRERAELVRDKLAAELRQVGEKINSLADDQVYRYGDREFSGAELKAEFAKIGFNITWNQSYGPAGAGENNDGIVSANLNWLEGQLAQNHPWGHWGTNWLILHELAHLLGVVEAFEREMWDAYLASLEPGEAASRDDWQRTEFFSNHEDLTDWIAYMLGLQLDLRTAPNPPPGYDPDLVGTGGAPGGTGDPGPGGNMPEY